MLGLRHRVHVRARRSKALVGETLLCGHEALLAKPLTFMNLSGEAVGALARRYRLDPADIIVVCDDVNLPLGRLRIRARGSAGGHKGLHSIIRSLGTGDYPRVRVGIGSPERDMVDFVLSRFRRDERKVVLEAVGRAADAVEAVLAEGIESAMNRFNAPSG